MDNKDLDELWRPHCNLALNDCKWIPGRWTTFIQKDWIKSEIMHAKNNKTWDTVNQPLKIVSNSPVEMG